MTNFIVQALVFIGALVYLKKAGYAKEDVSVLLAGMSGYNCVTAVSNIIIGFLSVSFPLVILSLIAALIHGYFFTIFAKDIRPQE